MTADELATDELVPLRTGFDLRWRGYSRGQVRTFVHGVESDLRLITADRDAALRCADLLTARLEALRRENRRLRTRLDRICRTPLDLDGVSESLRHLVDLAHEEAAEITARARAAAERSWAEQRRADADHHRRRDALLSRLEDDRRAAEVEHRELITRARGEVAALAREAADRRRELDLRAERLRERVRADFELAMSARRAEALQAVADQDATARRHAARIVQDAEQRVAVLGEQRDRITAELRAAARLLTEAGARVDAILPDA